MPVLHWIGKEKVVSHHQDVPFKALEHKYGFTAEKGEQNQETHSGNKIIHGDNLEALKSLLPEYEGKIKVIYIDPPYNTGNENWVYNDNVNHPKIKKWLGQVVGKESEDLTRHDKWLCMMYPRLKLLHKLLADDGAIFISIDDNELASLKFIMDEIFRRKNYNGLITRKQSSGAKNDTGNNKITNITDFIFVYSKHNFCFKPLKVVNSKKYKFSDKEGDFNIRALEMQGGDDTLPFRDKMGYSVYFNEQNNDIKLLFDYDLNNYPVYEEPNKELIKKGYKCYRPRKRGNELGRWRWGAETFKEKFAKNLVFFDETRVYLKERKTEFKEFYPSSLTDEFLNTIGTNELKTIFGKKKFEFPKPTELIKYLLKISTDKNSIILDSFAGSGTTAHAVLNLNKEDGGNRKFILVEMEDYAESITAERVKRVMQGYSTGDKTVEGTGGSFDFYELGQPIFKEDKNLNEEVGEDKIREYIYYTETKQHLTRQREKEHWYLLDTYNDTGYYFYYEKDQLTTLSIDSLYIVTQKAEQYIIYADVCLLDKDYMLKHNIIFKKIPRDIKRF